MERLTIRNSDGTYSQPTHTTFEKMFYKLAEFEDLLEEYDFEDIKTFKMAINLMQSMNSVGVKYCAENQKLKDRWQKLKEWVIKELGYASMYQEVRMDTLDEVKDKMQELDGGDIDVGGKE